MTTSTLTPLPMVFALLSIFPPIGRAAEPSPTRDPERPKASSYQKPPDDELRSRLSPEAYEVTQREGTEPPFENAYWDNHQAGIYVDVVSGEPLFSSLDKFDSGTGWPSFTRPIRTGDVQTRTDESLFPPRAEVRSTWSDSHLGHVFDDGPAPTGMRYCINSASLRFIPVDRMAVEGYSSLLSPFRLTPPRAAVKSADR